MAYRKDKNITREIPPFRKILNFLSPSRGAAIIYFEQAIDVTNTELWIADYQQRTGRKTNLLHLFLTFSGWLLHKNPRLNRYVTGNRFYQRDGVTISVSAKKKKENGGKIVLLKLPLYATDGLDDVQDRFLKMLGEGRDKEEIYQEKETRLFAMLPPFLLRASLKFIRLLDRYHLLPGFFVDPDPLYTSLVVANIGSIGLEPGYHHLYEYGNCPFFAMMGQVREQVVVREGVPQVRKIMTMRYSFDERIDDALACAYGLEAFKTMMEDPETALTQKPGEVAALKKSA